MNFQQVSAVIIASSVLLFSGSLFATQNSNYHCLELKLVTNTPVKLLLNRTRYAFAGEVRFIPKVVTNSAVIPFYPLADNKNRVRKFSYKFVYVENKNRLGKGCQFLVTRFSNGVIKIVGRPIKQKLAKSKQFQCVVTQKNVLKIIAPSK